MTDINVLLSNRIVDLERRLAEAQENGVQLLKMCSQKTNEIAELNQSKMPERIFSGEGSRKLWQEISSLDAKSTGDDVGIVLYSLCCSLQRLEDKWE